MIRRLALLGIALAVVGCGVATSPIDDRALTRQRPFTRLLVFGDSLSDTGNIQLQFGLPRWPYAFGRFSNGDNWIDHLARHFGLGATPSFLGGDNYAQGLAGTGDGLSTQGALPVSPNLLGQVELWGGRADGRELFVVWGGANDLFSKLSGETDATPQDFAANIEQVIRRLHGRGARSLVVPNVPNLAATPRYRWTPREADAARWTAEFNASLAARLDGLEQLPGIVIYRVDVAARFAEIVASPPPGVTNTTGSAYSGGYLGLTSPWRVAPQPDEYLFWDFIHPTRVGHRIMADVAIETIERRLDPAVLTGATLPPPVLQLPAPLEFWLYYFFNLGSPANG